MFYKMLYSFQLQLFCLFSFYFLKGRLQSFFIAFIIVRKLEKFHFDSKIWRRQAAQNGPALEGGGHLRQFSLGLLAGKELV